MCAGLWKAWFLPLLKGVYNPAMPREPKKTHIHQNVEVPYTPAEVAARAIAHTARMETYTTTMKV